MDSVGAVALALVTAIALYAGLRRLPENPNAAPVVAVYPVGETAVVVQIDHEPSGPPFQALVRVAGETWATRLNTPTIRIGDSLRVVGGDGLTLGCAAGAGMPETTGPVQTRASRIASGLSGELAALWGGPGLTVRWLRLLIAATCGLAVFTAITWGLPLAAVPAIAAVVLAALDPVLGELLSALAAF
jgi:hypothetical protein